MIEIRRASYIIDALFQLRLPFGTGVPYLDHPVVK